MTSVRTTKRRFHIYCDESGFHGSRLSGFGSLWLVHERRGDFQAIMRNLAIDHFAPSEVKWTKVKAATERFFLGLVDEFFQRNWLMFHALIFSKSEVDLAHHDGDWDLARRKLFTMLLGNKIKRFASAEKRYLVRVDPIHSRYQKAEEAAEIILRNIVEQEPTLQRRGVIESLRRADSRTTAGIQLSDFLLGAIMAARHNQVTSASKRAVVARICEHLGWDGLNYDTMPDTKKFNIWRFWDPRSDAPRPEVTRKRARHA